MILKMKIQLEPFPLDHWTIQRSSVRGSGGVAFGPRRFEGPRSGTAHGGFEGRMCKIRHSFDEFPTSYLCLFMFNCFILLYMFVVDFPASHVFTAKGSYNVYKNIIDQLKNTSFVAEMDD